MALLLLAQLCGKRGCPEAERFGRNLGQEELAAIGAWRNPRTGVRHPPGKSTIHRVLQQLDADALEDALAAWCRERQRPEQALAGDGKRINGANRHGCDHCETAALIEHESHLPIAVRGFRDQGGELAAMADLFERTDIAGRTVTLDALHTTRLAAQTLVERHGADYLLTVKGNCPETNEALQAVDWEADRTDWHSEEWDKARGRLECRWIEALAPLDGALSFHNVRQIARVTRCREEAPKLPPRKKHRELAAEARAAEAGQATDDSRKADSGEAAAEIAGKEPETVYPVTSLAPEAASAERLLGLCRGHWAVENMNHRQRDLVHGEDACLMRTGNGPANRATINNLALAVVFRSRDPATDRTLADTRTRLQMQRDQAIRALTNPWAGPSPPKPEEAAPAAEAARPDRLRPAGNRRDLLLIRTFGAGSAPPKPISSDRGRQRSICSGRMGKSCRPRPEPD